MIDSAIIDSNISLGNTSDINTGIDPITSLPNEDSGQNVSSIGQPSLPSEIELLDPSKPIPKLLGTENQNLFNLDIDGNGVIDDSDASLTFGYLNVKDMPIKGFMDRLVANFADPNGTRTTGDSITSYLQQGLNNVLDVDGDGKTNAYSDGLLISGYLDIENKQNMGLVNDLVNDLAESNNTYTTNNKIQAIVDDSLLPSVDSIWAGEGSTGDYNFRLLDLSTEAETINLGTTINGSLASSGEAQFYSFEGTATQRVLFDSLLESDNYGGVWTLYDSQGQYMNGNSLYGDFATTLPVDGEYLLVLNGDSYDSSNAIDYSFQVVEQEIEITTTALTIGEAVSGTINTVGDRAEYTFNGNIGQQLYYDDLNASSYLTLRLEGPSGDQGYYLYSTGYDQGSITLTENGTYKLIVGDDFGTGDYSFQLTDLSTAETIDLGTTINGSLNPSNEANFYRFDGTANQRLVFDNLSVSEIYAGGWTLYDSNNQYINSSTLDYDFSTILPADGQYLLVVNGYSYDSSNVIDYSFQIVEQETEITTTALTLGEAVSGSIEIGDQTEYTFNGNIGQQLYYDDLNTSGYSSGYFPLRLEGPSGTQEYYIYGTGYDQGPITLTEDGTYKLIVGGDFGSGDYNFRLVDLSTAANLNMDTTMNGTLNDGEADFYHFNGTAGQRVLLDNLFNSENYVGAWTLYDSNNQYISSNSLNVDFATTLPADGEYLLVLNGDSFEANNAIDYSFQVSTLETTTTALTFGEAVQGSIGVVGGQVEFTFDGNTGQQLYYDDLSGSNYLPLRLEDPNGNPIFYFNGNVGYYDRYPMPFSDPLTAEQDPVGLTKDAISSDMMPYFGNYNQSLITLTLDGTYKLIVGDDWSMGDYNFQLLDVSTKVEPLNLGITVNNVLDPSNEVDFYHFDGTVNQTLAFDNLSVSEEFAGDWTLYGADNQYIGGGNSLESDFTTTLPADGQYLLVLNGNSFNSGNPIEYSFALTEADSDPEVDSDPETTTTPLTLGETVSGSIDVAGNEVAFTFDANAGQWLYYDALSGSDYLPLRLLDPNGNQIFNFYGTGYDQGPTLLTEAGTYQLIVGGKDNFVYWYD